MKKRSDSSDTAITAMFIAVIIFAAAFWGTIFYVAWHFISKYW